MEKFSRPASLEDLKLLLRALNEHGVDYMLIGGYALAAHGYQRATTDIDVLVPSTLQSGQRVKQALMLLPDQAARALEPEWFEEGENIRVADAFVVDIMLNANGQTYESLRPYAETVDLEGIPVKTIKLEGLLLTKQTMREKDAADRIIIERALEVFRNQRGNS
jgi:predicted nucleotidyltransferase